MANAYDELENSSYPEKQRTLIEALERNDTAVVRAMLEEGVDSNDSFTKTVLGSNGIDTNKNVYPLEVVVQSGNRNLVKILVNEFDADPNIVTQEDKTLLMLAVERRDMPMIQCLMSCKIPTDINKAGTYQTPLQLAVFNKDYEIIEMLLSYSADINFTTMKGVSALVTAAMERDIDMVKYLLERGANANKFGITPVYCSASFSIVHQNLYSALETLVECGVDLTVPCAPAYRPPKLKDCLPHHNRGRTCTRCNREIYQTLTPLHVAILHGNAKMVKVLLSKDTVCCKTECGSTPLDLACSSGCVDIVCMIVELCDDDGQRYVDINARDKKGTTPLYVAVDHWYFDIVEALLKAGANVHLATRGGSTLLHAAARVHNENLFSYLVEKEGDNLDIAGQNRDGITPLMLAAQSDNLAVCQILIERGVPLNTRCRLDMSAFRYSISQRRGNYYTECSLELLVHGAVCANWLEELMTVYWMKSIWQEQKQLKKRKELHLTNVMGFPWKLLQNVPEDIDMIMDDALDRDPWGFTKKMFNSPLTLKQQVRLSIRKQFSRLDPGKSIVKYINLLTCIPSQLRDYLMFSEECRWYLESDSQDGESDEEMEY